MNSLIIVNNTSQQLQRIEQIQDNYSYTIRHFTKWLRETGKEINTDTIKDYFQDLDGAGYKARTIANKRAAVKKRMRQLFKNTGIEFKMKLDFTLKEIDQDNKTPRVNTEQVEIDKVISKDEFKQMLNKCRSDRQRLFIMFLYSTGCRVSELTGIELKNCNDQGEYVLVSVLGKGKKERNVRVKKNLYNAINELFQGKTYLFETSTGKIYQNDYVSKQVTIIGKRIDRKLTAHSLRHSFATNMIKAHPDKIDSISKYLGHSNVSITIGMYLHTQLSNEDLFGLID